MTAQIHEVLFLEGEKTSMAFCPPLPATHSQIKVNSKPGSGIFYSTACWRGYQGTWELKDGRFYLVSVQGRYIYTGKEPLFADWVTAVLRIPEGEMLHYVHMGFGSVYEFERHIKIENGLVVDERIIDNRKTDINPGELGWRNLPGGENHFDGDDL